MLCPVRQFVQSRLVILGLGELASVGQRDEILMGIVEGFISAVPNVGSSCLNGDISGFVAFLYLLFADLTVTDSEVVQVIAFDLIQH